MYGTISSAKNGVKIIRNQHSFFEDVVQSGCGSASAASGPFYCPADQKLYIDLSFYEELQDRFKERRDTAMAYVVAHEVGHHVQNLLGVADKAARERERLGERGYNKLSVKLNCRQISMPEYGDHYANRAKILEQEILKRHSMQRTLSAMTVCRDRHKGTVVPRCIYSWHIKTKNVLVQKRI